MWELYPGWTLRVSIPSEDNDVHLFNGVYGPCYHRFRPEEWHQRDLVFHPPTTTPTCRSCRRQGWMPQAVAPEIVRVARSRMVEYALANRDATQLAVALSMLSTPRSVEPYAELLIEKGETR